MNVRCKLLQMTDFRSNWIIKSIHQRNQNSKGQEHHYCTQIPLPGSPLTSILLNPVGSSRSFPVLIWRQPLTQLTSPSRNTFFIWLLLLSLLLPWLLLLPLLSLPCFPCRSTPGLSPWEAPLIPLHSVPWGSYLSSWRSGTLIHC